MPGSAKGIAFAFALALLAVSTVPAVAARDGATDKMPGRIEMTYEGPTLVTPAGMSLYAYYKEEAKPQGIAWQCTNAAPTTTNDQQSGIGVRPQIGFKQLKSCLQKFPPYVADADARPVGDFTIVQRPEGTRQWAYQGAPLYISANDRKPGDRNGLGAGGLFGGGGNSALARQFGGVHLAMQSMELPTGLKFVRTSDGLVVASSAGDRPLYTPRGGKRVVMAGTPNEDFKPVLAPAIAKVSGDWSIVQAAAGQLQYAFRGKPLYMAPTAVTEDQIAATRSWETIVVSKAPTRPEAIGKQLTLLGDVYTDKKGLTLYTYMCTVGGFFSGTAGASVSCDDAGDPAGFMVALCGDGKECARRWRPYIAPANARPEGEFSIIDITYPMFTDMRGTLYPSKAPRVRVWAYRGKPVFTYYEDEKPGDIWGNNTGGIWGSMFNALEVPGRSAITFEF